ncbi:hypothetical protein [Streptomyces sp. HC307]|uniref:hypothetical protein n=1 Tax=Streptomyces flavusporus TaxID=3385496 RepID=UPI003916CF81
MEVRFTGPDDAAKVLLDVPQGTCPLCGSRVYKLAVLQRIETAFKSGMSGRAPDRPG